MGLEQVSVRDLMVARTWPPRVLWGIALLACGFALAVVPARWAAIALGGIVVVGLTLIRPQFALYLLCFSIPFGSLFEMSLGRVTVGVTEALIALMIVAWIARVMAFRERIAWPQLSPLLALFVGVALFSLLNATSLTYSAKEILKWAEFGAVFVFVANAVTPQQGIVVVVCLLLAGVAQALLGVYQFLTGSGPEFFVLADRFVRAYGTFEQPNPYAGYLGLAAPLALALALTLLEQRRSRLRPGWVSWLGLASFGAIAAGIAMSWSRGAWLAFGAATVAVVIARARNRAALIAAAIVLAALVALFGGLRFVPVSVSQRLTSFVPFIGVGDVRSIEVTDDNYASLERLAHWQAALDMWRDHPWLGVGFGNYETVYPDYALPKWPFPLGHAHNYYVNIAAETGLAGLVAYVVLWSAALWQTWNAVRRSATPCSRVLAVAALGVLVHASVHNVVDNLWVHNMYIHVAIVLGLVFGQASGDTGHASLHEPDSRAMHGFAEHRAMQRSSESSPANRSQE